MATKTKPFDNNTRPEYRSTTFTDSDFVATDVLDIQASLGRSGVNLVVETAADASVTFRLNAVRTQYGKRADFLSHGIGFPDFTNSATVTDTTINTITVENGDTLTENIVVKNIQITALTAGSGVTFKIR